MAISSIVGSAVLSGLSKVIRANVKGNCQKPDSPPPPPSAGIKKSLGDALRQVGLDTSKLEKNSAGAKAFVRELFDKLHAQGKGNFQADLKSLTTKLSGDEGSLDSLKEKFSQLATALGGSSTASLQGLLQNLQSGEETKGTLVSTAA